MSLPDAPARTAAIAVSFWTRMGDLIQTARMVRPWADAGCRQHAILSRVWRGGSSYFDLKNSAWRSHGG